MGKYRTVDTSEDSVIVPHTMMIPVLSSDVPCDGINPSRTVLVAIHLSE